MNKRVHIMNEFTDEQIPPKEQKNLDEFNDKFKGETCFILGSGPSVNLVDLSLLANRLTIAVNSAIVALPSAKFFVSDDWAVANWNFFDDLKKSQTVALLYEDKLSKHADEFDGRAVIFRHRKGYHLSKPYRHNIYEQRVFEARTSVGTAVHIAYIMGCKEIVLIGVDCCRLEGCRYFWQDNEKYNVARNDDVPVDGFRKVTVHGNEMDTDLFSILYYWEKVSNVARGKIEIFNSSPISVVDCFKRVDWMTCV